MKFLLSASAVAAAIATLAACAPEMDVLEACSTNVEVTAASDVQDVTLYAGDTLTLQNTVLISGAGSVGDCGFDLTDPDNGRRVDTDVPTSFPAPGVFGHQTVVTEGGVSRTVLVRVTVKPKVSTVPLMPVIELFTGADCPPCAAADQAVIDVKEADHDGLAVIAWHMSIPAYDEWSMAEFNSPSSDILSPDWYRWVGYRGTGACCSTPMMIGGGVTGLYSGDVATVKSTLESVQVPYTIDIETLGNRAMGTVRVRVDVSNLGSSTITDTQLNVLVYEDDIPNKPEYVTMTLGIPEFDETARQFAVEGEALTLNPGRTSITRDIILGSTWYDKDALPRQELGVIAWLQNVVNTTSAYSTTTATPFTVYVREIRQAAFEHIEFAGP